MNSCVRILNFRLRKSHRQPSRGVLKKRCSENIQQFTGEHPCWNVISRKLQCNFVKIPLRYECSPVNLLHIFRPPFRKNIFGWLPLKSYGNLMDIICYFFLKIWNFWPLFTSRYKSSYVRKDVLRNFAKFKEKHMCQSLFFKFCRLTPATVLKKRLF